MAVAANYKSRNSKRSVSKILGYLKKFRHPTNGFRQLIAVTPDNSNRNAVETGSYTQWNNQAYGSVHRGTDQQHRFQSSGYHGQQHQHHHMYNKGLDQVPDSPEADLKRLFNPAMVVEDTVPKQTSDQWEDLTQFLDKFQSIFSQNKNSQQEYKEIQTQIEELLKVGFNRPSHSPYAAPVTLSYKKDEGKRSRLCIDYRKLNEITRKDSTPVPLIDFAIDNLTLMLNFSLHSIY
ncbi:retrotransposable element Tf2 protein type 1 [Trichonephila clavipes]|uniref:Retrotransposable element Tf2 protein type 1 n=1 Tax=Trichonephila clavipes TaxID=2585209 RepID=A0A8X6UVV5_TRICX|nr:retrotransposable element Tf2 protein type 1 [Trichonephila clavipes]